MRFLASWSFFSLPWESRAMGYPLKSSVGAWLGPQAGLSAPIGLRSSTWTMMTESTFSADCSQPFIPLTQHPILDAGPVCLRY